MSNSDTDQSPAEAVDVTIFNQTYRLRSKIGSHYVLRIARLVDERMREISSQVTTHDVARIAILTALNIADEMQTIKDRYETAGAQAGAGGTQAESAHEERPQSWFEDFFEAKVETKSPGERLSSQVSAKLQSLRQPGPEQQTTQAIEEHDEESSI